MKMPICTLIFLFDRLSGKLRRRHALLLALLIAPAAHACPSGYYETCFIKCWCNPRGDVVASAVAAAVNPLPDHLNVLGGVVSGNISQLSQGVGGLVIKSSCPGCATMGQLLIDKPDREFLERTVGRGWLFYMGGVEPTLIVADAATSIATRYVLKPPPLPVQQLPPPADRGTKEYTASIAACIVEGDNKAIVIGWADAPTLKDVKTGAVSTVPTIDLRRDDVVSVTSDDSCPAVPDGQRKYKHAKVVFNDATGILGTPTSMKFFFLGTLYPESVR